MLLAYIWLEALEKEHGIKYKRHKCFEVATDSIHDKLIYPNVLSQQFDAKRPNESWVSDITYIWIAEGCRCTQQVLKTFNKYMLANLVTKAFNTTIKNNKCASQRLTVHSDRDSQYCNYAYYKIIQQYHFKGLISGKGTCFNNALIEIFWSRLKNELIYNHDYETTFTAVNNSTSYIKLCYNQIRTPKVLGYISPRQIWFDFCRQSA